jgi:hypothetical protein
MPKPSRHELFCAALYTLTGGKLKGRMVTTMADELGITFEDAEALAEECARRGWLEHAMHTVTLRQDGYAAALRVLEPPTAAAPDRPRPRRPKPQRGAGRGPRTSAPLPARP